MKGLSAQQNGGINVALQWRAPWCVQLAIVCLLKEKAQFQTMCVCVCRDFGTPPDYAPIAPPPHPTFNLDQASSLAYAVQPQLGQQLTLALDAGNPGRAGRGCRWRW